ncbi:uncharacterized protein LOC110185951 [Drosophila serrata]|uniref:uncharacterized protein LOC110185951 n=1 Tax=Drosophila serrata TaxID=7274 RepID=UPI000A1D1E20|nr:uncharacterized protein LOC110185951 [Drosophila serrata]
MINNDICETLLAVKEVELSFERTLRNINNIQHRYNMVSSLKRKAAKAKESFEAEIQAAITEPTPNKEANPSRKVLKKKKMLPLVGKKKAKRGKKEKLTPKDTIKKDSKAPVVEPSLIELEKQPRKSLKKKILPRMKKVKQAKRTKLAKESPLPELLPIPYEENTFYEFHSTATPIVHRKPFSDLIRRLYRAARWKAQQEAMDQQDLEQSPDCFTCSCSCSSC